MEEKNLICKSAQVVSLKLDETELLKINKFTLDELKEEDVFIFKIAVCDNEVDRQFEVFPLNSLQEMAKLFVGKTIIKDHKRESDNQVARIYDCEVVKKDGVTKTGEDYYQLVASCYLVKTDTNKDLIKDITAGIKKEVSVSCMISKAVCSICGRDNYVGFCEHFNGKMYDGKLCYFSLLEPLDAYEVSFVAVPAQRNAGVTKSYSDKTYEDKEKAKQDSLTKRIKSIESFILEKGETK